MEIVNLVIMILVGIVGVFILGMLVGLKVRSDNASH